MPALTHVKTKTTHAFCIMQQKNQFGIISEIDVVSDLLISCSLVTSLAIEPSAVSSFVSYHADSAIQPRSLVDDVSPCMSARNTKINELQIYIATQL